MTEEDISKLIKDVITKTLTPLPSITIAEWVLAHKLILNERKYAKQTLKNKYANIKHILAYFSNVPMNELKPYDISKALNNHSASTATRILSELKDIYSEAIANGVLSVNPTSYIKSPRVIGQRKRLPLETYLNMLEESYNYNIPWIPQMLLLAMITGQRRSDLVKMKFEDVIEGSLRVEQQKKSGKVLGARLAIPLSTTLNCLGCSLYEVIEFCRFGSKSGNNLLRKANGTPLEISSLSSRFHELLIIVEGTDKYKQFEYPSLHEVRSLSARTFLSEGMLSTTVQILMGHKSENMTKMYLDDRGLAAEEYKLVI